MKLSTGLHRIGNDVVAAYLVATDEGITVIDAGLPGNWHDLVRELRDMGRSLDDIKGVILTHGDSDHLGFAERLRRDHGVPIFVHSADAARARGEEKTSPAMGPVKVGPMMKFIINGLRKNGLRTTFVKKVEPIESGDVLALPGAPVIIGLPGHSPGSIAIHVPIVDAVFVGDGLTTGHVLTGATGPGPAPFTDDPAEALASLQHLEGIGATWVLPGHGAPFNGGVDAAVQQIRNRAH